MPIYINLEYEDSYASTKSKRFEMVAATLTQAELDAPGVVSALQAASDAIIRKWTLSEENLVAGPVPAETNIDAGMTLRGQLDGRTKKTAIKLPTPVAGVINPDRSIDISDALIVAIFGLFDAAGTPTLKVSDGEQLSAIISGVLDR